MKRVLLVIAYDGTNYCGWQVQENAVTIEGQLNKVISDYLQEDIKVIGASRTDAGVHALENIAVFDTKTNIPIDRILYGLNQRLPEDIIIKKSIEVDKDFHPRKHESIKTYQYTIQNSKYMPPNKRLYSHLVKKKLDIEKMKKAANHLIGQHDFTSFSSVKSSANSKIRTIYEIKIQEHGTYIEGDKAIEITIKGNGFLYNMVRIIVGTLIEVGQGIYLDDEVHTILLGKDRNLAGVTAPAKGLILLETRYQGESYGKY